MNAVPNAALEFCDTNVIVYAFDQSAGRKHLTARRLVERLWLDRLGTLSVQVLQESLVVLTRKIANPLPSAIARGIVEDLIAWRVAEPSAADVLEAIDLADRWHLSFWDGMLLAAARKVGAKTIWSEDLNDGQDYDGVIVRNPFGGAS